MAGRIFVLLLSLAGLALAYRPPATILQIATQTFTGLAVLFPTVIFGLYLKRLFPLAAILSIIGGEGALICFYFKWIPNAVFLPVVWVMIVTFSLYLIVHGILLWREKMFRLCIPGWVANRHVYLFAGIFLLAMDFWAWGKTGPVIFGIPAWVGYFIGLSVLQTVGMVHLVRQNDHFSPPLDAEERNDR